ncbi:hypothetical protein Trydic_g21453 [Trypoxylus dichotomus]
MYISVTTLSREIFLPDFRKISSRNSANRKGAHKTSTNNESSRLFPSSPCKPHTHDTPESSSAGFASVSATFLSHGSLSGPCRNRAHTVHTQRRTVGEADRAT